MKRFSDLFEHSIMWINSVTLRGLKMCMMQIVLIQILIDWQIKTLKFCILSQLITSQRLFYFLNLCNLETLLILNLNWRVLLFFLLPLYFGSKVWEGIWNQTYLEVLNFYLGSLHRVTISHDKARSNRWCQWSEMFRLRPPLSEPSKCWKVNLCNWDNSLEESSWNVINPSRAQ